MQIERRHRDRRASPSRRMDVTRLEHENLCDQVDDMLRTLRRLENELREQDRRIAALAVASTRDSSAV